MSRTESERTVELVRTRQDVTSRSLARATMVLSTYDSIVLQKFMEFFNTFMFYQGIHLKFDPKILK